MGEQRLMTNDEMCAVIERGTKEVARLQDVNDTLLKACRRAKKLLEPVLDKEPDRTIFWELVEAIRKAEGKEQLFQSRERIYVRKAYSDPQGGPEFDAP